MKLSQCILRHLSNNIQKNNDLSYYQGRPRDEKWLLAQISSNLIFSLWKFLKLYTATLTTEASLWESNKTPEQRTALSYFAKHTNTFWTDKTSIQEMHVSRSSHPKRMNHCSCQFVDSTSGKVFHLKVCDWPADTDDIHTYDIQPMNIIQTAAESKAQTECISTRSFNVRRLFSSSSSNVRATCGQGIISLSKDCNDCSILASDFGTLWSADLSLRGL